MPAGFRRAAALLICMAVATAGCATTGQREPARLDPPLSRPIERSSPSTCRSSPPEPPFASIVRAAGRYVEPW